MATHCPYCGSDDIEFLGIVDGAGDYGDMLCEQWECVECGEVFDGMCEDELYEGGEIEPEEEGAVDNDGEGFGYDPYPTEDSPLYLIPPADIDDIPF